MEVSWSGYGFVQIITDPDPGGTKTYCSDLDPELWLEVNKNEGLLTVLWIRNRCRIRNCLQYPDLDPESEDPDPGSPYPELI
jgi:hypothetical protein